MVQKYMLNFLIVLNDIMEVRGSEHVERKLIQPFTHKQTQLSDTDTA